MFSSVPLGSHGKATHHRLSGQLHPRLVSHLYVAMGTVLLVTSPSLPPANKQLEPREVVLKRLVPRVYERDVGCDWLQESKEFSCQLQSQSRVCETGGLLFYVCLSVCWWEIAPLT